MTLSNSDKSLITSLATALHSCVTIHKKKEVWRFRGHPRGWNIYSDVCATLWKLNLAKITNGGSGYCMDFHKYIGAPDMIQIPANISIDGFYCAELVSLNDIGSNINFINWGEHINSKTLIEQFVLCMSKLGVIETLPVSRKSGFEVQDYILTSAMDELVNHDFAIRQSNKYQWTDKISVHMISNYLWTQDEVIESKIDTDFIANSLDKIVSKALNKIPYFSRGNISTYTSLGMSIALLEHWDGKSWHDEVLSSPAISFENAMGISNAFLNLYCPSRDSNKWSLKQHKKLSENEKKLVFTLVKFFHRTWERSMFQQGEELIRGYAHHGCTGVFENSAYDLWVLGLAVAAWPTKNLYDVTYKQYKSYYENPQNLGALPCIKLVPKGQIDEHISFDDFYPSLSVYDIICSFLELASDYGGKLSVDRHSKFKAPSSDFEPVLKVFTDFGYAEKIGFEYKWTDKISIHMIKNYDWEEDDFNPSSVDSNFVNQTFSQIEDIGIGQIPREVPDGYLGRFTGNVLGLTFCILRNWSDINWSKEPLATPSMSMDNAIAIARKILEKYKHNDDCKNHRWLRV